MDLIVFAVVYLVQDLLQLYLPSPGLPVSQTWDVSSRWPLCESPLELAHSDKNMRGGLLDALPILYVRACGRIYISVPMG